VLCIRIGSNADPDPAFYQDQDPGSQNNAVQILVRLKSHKKLNLREKLFKEGNN